MLLSLKMLTKKVQHLQNRLFGKYAMFADPQVACLSVLEGLIEGCTHVHVVGVIKL